MTYFHRVAAISRPENGRRFFGPVAPWIDSREAEATIQWDRFLVSRKPQGHTVVRINMDETSLKLFPGVEAGCVASSERHGPHRPVEQGVSLRAQRGALSYIAFVTDDRAVQERLPQVLVSNARLVPETAAREFAADRSDRVFLLRQKSSWVQAKTLARIVRLLGACLQPVAAGKFFILSMDACPVHITGVVLRAVASVGVHFMLIPAQATRWLQPCDVAVFRTLKHRIRRRYLELQVTRARAELEVADVLRVFATAITEVISGGVWAPAFSLCGLHEGLPSSKRFRLALGPEPLPATPPALPSLAQLQCVFPRRREIPIDLLFQNLLHPVPVGLHRLHRRSETEGARRPSGEMAGRPWQGRTRTTSRASHAAAGVPPTAATGSSVPDLRSPAGRPAVPIAHRLWGLAPCRKALGALPRRP